MITRRHFFAAILFVLVSHKCNCEGGYEVHGDGDHSDDKSSSSDDITMENGPINGNNDDDDDNEDGGGLSAVAVVAIAAGIPIGVVVIISIIVIIACILASRIKRRNTLETTNDRNLSVNQYVEGFPMAASSNNEDSEMVYNSAYQSVSQDGQSAVLTTGNN